jgi:hypothetical protein
MSEILQAGQLRVGKDLSGGIKIAIGGSAGLLSPEQAVEFATVVLRLAGVNVEFSSKLPPAKQQHFLTG